MAEDRRKAHLSHACKSNVECCPGQAPVGHLEKAGPLPLVSAFRITLRVAVPDTTGKVLSPGSLCRLAWPEASTHCFKKLCLRLSLHMQHVWLGIFQVNVCVCVCVCVWLEPLVAWQHGVHGLQWPPTLV